MNFFNTNAKSKSSIKTTISSKILPRMIVIFFSLTIISLLSINLLMKKTIVNTIKSTPKENSNYIKPLQSSKFSNINKRLFNVEFDNNKNAINYNSEHLIPRYDYKETIPEPQSANQLWNNKIDYKKQLKKLTKNINFEKNITLTPIYLFDKQLPFYKKVTIDESPLLSFMSQLEIFYSISILILIIVIISALIIALLYKQILYLFESLNIKNLFTKSKTKNNLSEETNVISNDEITKNF